MRRATSVSGFSINEYGAFGDEQQPGPSAWYIARLERANGGTDGARANWGMVGQTPSLYATLGWLMTPNNQPMGTMVGLQALRRPNRFAHGHSAFGFDRRNRIPGRFRRKIHLRAGQEIERWDRHRDGKIHQRPGVPSLERKHNASIAGADAVDQCFC